MNPITKTLCEDEARLNFLPHYLGPACIAFENRLFHLAHSFLENYSGGYWQFYHLDRNGFICVLERDEAETMSLYSPNGLIASTALETASMALCLMALSSLSFEIRNPATLERVVGCFDVLREFALQHPERETILALID